jgi:hypothetical protein
MPSSQGEAGEGTMSTRGLLLFLLGLLGLLLCGAGLAGSWAAHGAATDTVDDLCAEATALLDDVDGELAAIPPAAVRLRNELAEKLASLPAERLAAEIDAVRAKVDAARATGAAALAVLRAAASPRSGREAADAAFPVLAGLSAVLAEVSARLLEIERGEGGEPGPLLLAIEETVSAVRGELAATRAAVGRLRTRVRGRLDLVAILAATYLVWMGLGQAALLLAGRRRLTRGRRAEENRAP